MTIDTAFAALVEANPIPDADAYAEYKLTSAAFLTATRERTIDMQTIEQQESKKANPQRNWQPLAAVAVFILVIAIGVATALAVRGGNDDVTNVPAPPFETPQEAVEAYVAVMNAGDGEAYVSMFAEGATDSEINSTGQLPEDKVKARIEASRAVGATWTVQQCNQESDVLARCTVSSVEPLGALIFGNPDLERSVIATIDSDGLIARMGINVAFPVVDEARDAAQFAWISENYPELLDEWRFGVWGSDPLLRSGADIGLDYLSATMEFDAQYEG